MQSSLVPSSTETCFRAPDKAMPPCGTQNVSGAVSLGSSPITLPLELQIPFHSPSTLSYLELLLHLTSFLYLLRELFPLHWSLSSLSVWQTPLHLSQPFLAVTAVKLPSLSLSSIPYFFPDISMGSVIAAFDVSARLLLR